MNLLIRKPCFLFLLLRMWPMVSHAQEVTVPPNLQAALFSKVLPFDRNLQSRAKGTIVIGIVYQSRFRMSLNVHEEFFDAMSKLPMESIADLPYQLVSIVLIRQALSNRLQAMASTFSTLLPCGLSMLRRSRSLPEPGVF